MVSTSNICSHTTGKKPYKVISLIDNLGISGSYNFLADSMRWSNFNVSIRIKLPLNHTLSLTGQFDPYMYELNESGRPVRVNKLYWNHGKFPHFLGTGTTLSYTFNNDTFKKWFGKKDKKNNNEGEDGTTGIPDGSTDRGTPDSGSTDSRDDDENFIKTEIPWSLSISYTVRYGEDRSNFDYERMRYKMQWTHNLNITGSISLGKGWKVSANTSYDFKSKQFTYTNFNVTRDLHCWTMTASFVPFGPYKSYTFHIGVNASMLSDLKYDKSSADSTNKRVNWW